MFVFKLTLLASFNPLLQACFHAGMGKAKPIFPTQSLLSRYRLCSRQSGLKRAGGDTGFNYCPNKRGHCLNENDIISGDVYYSSFESCCYQNDFSKSANDANGVQFCHEAVYFSCVSISDPTLFRCHNFPQYCSLSTSTPHYSYTSFGECCSSSNYTRSGFENEIAWCDNAVEGNQIPQYRCNMLFDNGDGLCYCQSSSDGKTCTFGNDEPAAPMIVINEPQLDVEYADFATCCTENGLGILSTTASGIKYCRNVRYLLCKSDEYFMVAFDFPNYCPYGTEKRVEYFDTYEQACLAIRANTSDYDDDYYCYNNENRLRLINRDDDLPYGLLEVNHNGEWSNVCGLDWNFINARVVCRLLGFQNFENSEYWLWGDNEGADGAPYGVDVSKLEDSEDEVKTKLIGLTCFGPELNIDDCLHVPWNMVLASPTNPVNLTSGYSCDDDYNVLVYCH